MKVKIISSGSKANCTLICCGDTNILIDVGPTTVYIAGELAKVNLTPMDIDIILITHTHSDHIKGLKTFMKKTNALVYITEDIKDEIIKLVPIKQIRLMSPSLTLDNIHIELLEMSHDVICHGMIISYDDKELVYITDTGYVNKKYLSKIINKDIYIMETNYNEEMLMNGPYPYHLKQRILGDSGHLSNRYAGNLLSKCIGEKTKYVFLAHISEHNNTKKLVLEEVTDELKNINFDLNKLILTSQLESCEMVEI